MYTWDDSLICLSLLLYSSKLCRPKYKLEKDYKRKFKASSSKTWEREREREREEEEEEEEEEDICCFQW